MASYSLHIERDNQISVSEWLAICESDSSLTVQHVAKAMNPETGETIEIQTFQPGRLRLHQAVYGSWRPCGCRANASCRSYWAREDQRPT